MSSLLLALTRSNGSDEVLKQVMRTQLSANLARFIIDRGKSYPGKELAKGIAERSA
jgi:hypothetical protein